ncbi:MAG TPA: cation:proton antiporter [Tepidisphaeraceae bacterium]|jgi:Kef-type K+ transport system membrane component KefB/nucleotide-binding universal stress UspA family protein
MKDAHTLAILLAQIAVILGIARLMGMAAGRLRQPQVIGEILAGILLGPTLLGWVWPAGYGWLFPPGNMIILNSVAQLGVIVFLFLVGLEFDPKIVERHGKAAVVISISGIAIPFVIGFAATYGLLELFDEKHRADPFPTALFMGAAMSVTAFPVLARIVAERNLAKTIEGSMAIAAAAVDDVLAWTMLAVVVAFVPGGGDSTGPLTRIGLALAYVCLMLFVVRPFLRRLELIFDRSGRLSANVVAILLFVLLCSALSTELIGVHALFGAFVAGFVMPKGNRFVHALTEKLETFAIVFLLPTFFAYAGLKADLRDILHWNTLGYTLLIIALACVGKFGGGVLASRAMGMTWHQGLTIGVLMNTRGLMELIILTVGLQLGVINRTVYGMMVVMALATTAMAGPLLQLLMPRRAVVRDAADKIFTVLIPIARPDSGGPLLQMAALLSRGEQQSHTIALHLTRPRETELYRSFTADVLAPANLDELKPILAEAESLEMRVEPMSFYSRDVPADIARVVRQQNVDLVLMGYHMPVFSRTLLGGVVSRVLTGTDCDVGIFIDRNYRQPTRVLVPFMGSVHDQLALKIADKVGRACGAAITVLHVTQNPGDVREPIDRAFADPTQKAAVTVKVVPGTAPAEAVLSEAGEYDLVIVGVTEEWGLESSLLGMRPERIARDCPSSMLIVRRFVQAEERG